MTRENWRQLVRACFLAVLVSGIGSLMLGRDWMVVVALVAGLIGYIAFPPFPED